MVVLASLERWVAVGFHQHTGGGRGRGGCGKAAGPLARAQVIIFFFFSLLNKKVFKIIYLVGLFGKLRLVDCRHRRLSPLDQAPPAGQRRNGREELRVQSAAVSQDGVPLDLLFIPFVLFRVNVVFGSLFLGLDVLLLPLRRLGHHLQAARQLLGHSDLENVSNCRNI